MKKYEALKLDVRELQIVDVIRTSEVDPAGADGNWVSFEEGGE